MTLSFLEAVPFLAEFAGATVVVKYGGHAMTSPELRTGFAADMVALHRAGLRRVGIASEFAGGLRVTSAEAMEIVRMVLIGQVGSDVVAEINKCGGPTAVGLSGADGGLLTAVRRPAWVDGLPVDIGQVGDAGAV